MGMEGEHNSAREVFKPELHAFVYKAIFEVADQAIGSASVDRLLDGYGATRSQLLDSEAWVSLEFTEAFLDDLFRAAGDPQLFGRAARLAMSPRHMGPRRAFIRAFATPMSTYMLVAKTAATMNKTGTYEVERTGRTSCVLRFRLVAGVGPEWTPHMCRFRAVTIASVPVVFDLAPARLEHPTCIANGDSVCEYRLSWTEPPRTLAPLFGALLGGSAGAAYQLHLGLGSTQALLGACALGVGGWAVGRVLQLRRELSERAGDVVDQHEALEASLLANEQRFAELLEAKTEVERKVDERTRELRDATTRLSATLEELQALSRAKTDFFNNVSHELRTPLTLILGPLQDMIDGREPPSGQKTALSAMQRNAARLLELINQILDLAKVDAQAMQIHRAPVDAVALVKDIVTTFRTEADRRGVALRVETPADEIRCSLDAPWVQSAITNLVANALRVVARGGHVVVRVSAGLEELRVDVEDDGPGIRVEDQAVIFERFAQGSDTRTARGGTGLGLAIVRAAAQLHGGDAHLVSREGHGTTFTLRLPTSFDLPAVSIAPAAVSRAGIELAKQALGAPERAPASASRPPPPGDAPFVLVVEDNDDLRNYMADILATRYRTMVASDGDQGLALCLAERPELVVSDVAMPKLDGFTLCRRLRATEQGRTLPVILVTAASDPGHVLEGFAAGANDYIAKPFHAPELLARVDVHVKLRRMVSELARRERLAMLGSMAAAVAHQVRNPLTTLVSGLPAMRDRFGSKLDARSLQLLEVMVDCAGRIEGLTSDLLDVAKIDREPFTTFQPGEGLMAALRLTTARLSAVEVELRTNVDCSARLEGRPGDLNQALLNLLDNAARAVGNHGVIEVTGALDGGEYVITVADSGSGVDPAIADRIFEPFWTSRPAGQGTGLGLAIVKQVVEQHGGSVRVERSELGGAAFVIRLPGAMGAAPHFGDRGAAPVTAA